MNTLDEVEKIDKYTILGIAGQGNMGVVYAGHDPYTDRKVAIKVCPTDDQNTRASRVARKLFFNEAHAAGALDHPNILAVLDAAEQDDKPYIVMEYVEGARTLRDHITVDNLLPIDRAVTLIYQCAKALDYAHRRGVVHRDIKPSNVMLGEGDVVKIADFGIAQYALADATQVMGVLGSPRYMSPEQAREDDVNHQTDLFSLGILSYELLTGRSPFAAKGFSALINKILHEHPPAIQDYRAEIPAALAAIVMKMLEKPLGRRYNSGREVAVDLAAAYANLRQAVRQLSESEKFEVTRKLRFFNEFSDGEVREISLVSDWEFHGSGDEIISEGNLEHCFYILVEGEVEVSKAGKAISLLTKGDCFGEMGYLARAKRTATIMAFDDITLLKISSAHIEGVSLHCQLRFTQVFLQTLIGRLARTSQELSRHVG